MMSDAGDDAGSVLAGAQPVLIIGAGRSGTNLLAEILGQDPRFWNAFENRYIWNYGARTLAHDVRRAEEASPRARAYIRRFFARTAERRGRIVVDKTPSNVFRVGFAAAVLPEARFINLIRDGRDNVLSRRIEWYGGRSTYRQAPVEGRAQRAEGGVASAQAAEVRKAWATLTAGNVRRSDRIALLRQRIGHMRDLAGRGNLPPERWGAFLADNLGPFLRNLITGQPSRYAERFPGMAEALQAYGLLETAAIQWREGVMQATHAGRQLPAERYLELRYEDLLSDPEGQWGRIAAFLGIAAEGPCLDYVRASVRRGNVEKWQGGLTAEELQALEPHLRPTLEYLGYRWA